MPIGSVVVGSSCRPPSADKSYFYFPTREREKSSWFGLGLYDGQALFAREECGRENSSDANFIVVNFRSYFSMLCETTFWN